MGPLGDLLAHGIAGLGGGIVKGGKFVFHAVTRHRNNEDNNTPDPQLTKESRRQDSKKIKVKSPRPKSDIPQIDPPQPPSEPSSQAVAQKKVLRESVKSLDQLSKGVTQLLADHPEPASSASPDPTKEAQLKAGLKQANKAAVKHADALLQSFELKGVLDDLDPKSTQLATDLQNAIVEKLKANPRYLPLNHNAMAVDLMHQLLACGSVCLAASRSDAAQQRVDLKLADAELKGINRLYGSDEGIREALIRWSRSDAAQDATNNERIKALKEAVEKRKSNKKVEEEELKAESSEGGGGDTIQDEKTSESSEANSDESSNAESSNAESKKRISETEIEIAEREMKKKPSLKRIGSRGDPENCFTFKKNSEEKPKVNEPKTPPRPDAPTVKELDDKAKKQEAEAKQVKEPLINTARREREGVAGIKGVFENLVPKTPPSAPMEDASSTSSGEL